MAPSKQNLSPYPLSFVSEYPTFHVLGLNNKNPIAGNKDVIDLSRPVGRWQNHIMKRVVGSVIQTRIDLGSDLSLSDTANEPRRPRHRKQHQQY